MEGEIMKSGVNVTFRVPEWLDKICAWPVMVYRKYKYGYSFRKIDLGQGEWTIVDQEDYYRFGNLKWSAIANNGKLYAACNIKIAPMKTSFVRLHRLILNPPPGLLVDHKNSKSLDNRRANLRPATRSQNACNRTKRKSNTSSKYIGASLDKRRGTFTGRIYVNGKKIFLGYFDNEIDAARAYDRAALKYHGEFARLNFPREDYVNEVLPING